MSEREPDENNAQNDDDQSTDEFVEEIEDDPSLAGNSPEDEELRGG